MARVKFLRYENDLDKMEDKEDLKACIQWYDQQLDQCCYVARCYEDKLRILMGPTGFSIFMNEVISSLRKHEKTYQNEIAELEASKDLDLDEIVEDIKNVSSDNGSNADNK